MTHDEARVVICGVLARVAPDTDPFEVEPDTDLRDGLDLDSMDVVALVEGVSAATGIDIPDADAAAVGTLGEFTDYLVVRSTPPPHHHVT